MADEARESGQALPLALGGVLLVVAGAVALAAVAGAASGKMRAQRAADLAAVAGARSMRDDLPRLLAPSRLPDGSVDARHLEKADYLRRARRAALLNAIANGAGRDTVRIGIPDRRAFAPLRVRVAIAVGVGADGRHPGGALTARVSATAEASSAPATRQPPARARGGGYSGRLAYRQGEGMRPDVAAAFDRMTAAARRAGLFLVVNSGFRSDAEQARLYAANPDPRWVAPPGRSLHRCATELDLGPPSAIAWLAANARRFGFVQRYSWEAWHFGFDRPPRPCSAAGNTMGAGPDGRAAGDPGLPGYVPARLRATLLRSASRWSVSAALLAAQLMAESNFNPYAVSPVGAEGIAQFMPSTAAAYGLADPFDAAAAIDAQARMMSDLLSEFDADPRLALAAYNAGPAPVEACDCVPGYPETQAYVSRILALMGGAGATPAEPSFEVRLIA